MKSKIILLLLSLFAFFVNASIAQVIITVAGNGTPGSPVPGTQATSSGIVPQGIAVDDNGNLFVVCSDNYIYKIKPDGIVSIVAGTGIAGFSGDGGPATNAKFSMADGLCLDKQGNIYFNDDGNYRIRRIDTSGIITSIAGNGTSGYSGDGGPATDAMIFAPHGICVSRTGDVYFSDQQSLVRKVALSGIITTVAGNYSSTAHFFDGCSATAVGLSVYDLAIDRNNILYFTFPDGKIAMLDTLGHLFAIAGNGTRGFSGDGGSATDAKLSTFSRGICVDTSGNVYFSDEYNERIRKVNRNGVITTVAGNGYYDGRAYGGFSGDGGQATNAELNDPLQVAIDRWGNLYINDGYNVRIRKVISGTEGISRVPDDATFELYPNPACKQFTIRGASCASDIFIQVCDVSGVVLLSRNIASQEAINEVFDVSCLPPGVYEVVIKSNEFQSVQKLLVE